MLLPLDVMVRSPPVAASPPFSDSVGVSATGDGDGTGAIGTKYCPVDHAGQISVVTKVQGTPLVGPSR